MKIEAKTRQMIRNHGSLDIQQLLFVNLQSYIKRGSISDERCAL